MTSVRRLPTMTIVLLLLAGAARAAVPSPANSSYPPCLVSCPLGDITFDVVVHDFANNPVAGSSVVLDFLHCPGAFVCTTSGPDPYVYNPVARTVTRVTDATGLARFPLRVGGGCASGGVFLYADGVLFRSYALASPDQDGNGLVVSNIGLDDPTFAAKMGTADPTADFDCDGDVDAADQQIFFSHHSHSCDGFVDAARRSTWSGLKLHYR